MARLPRTGVDAPERGGDVPGLAQLSADELAGFRSQQDGNQLNHIWYAVVSYDGIRQYTPFNDDTLTTMGVSEGMTNRQVGQAAVTYINRRYAAGSLTRAELREAKIMTDYAAGVAGVIETTKSFKHYAAKHAAEGKDAYRAAVLLWRWSQSADNPAPTRMAYQPPVVREQASAAPIASNSQAAAAQMPQDVSVEAQAPDAKARLASIIPRTAIQLRRQFVPFVQWRQVNAQSDTHKLLDGLRRRDRVTNAEVDQLIQLTRIMEAAK